MKPETVVRKVRNTKTQLHLTLRETARLLGMRASDVQAILGYPRVKVSPKALEQAGRVLRSFRHNPTSQFLRAATRLAEAGATPREIADLASSQAELVQLVGVVAGIKGNQS